MEHPDRMGHNPRALKSLLLLLLIAGACSEPAAPANDRLLVGQWGSADAELIAIEAGAEVRMACATVIINDPISLTAEQSFVARGRVRGSGATLGTLPVVSVTGVVSGTQLRVTFPDGPGASPRTRILEAGVTLQRTEPPMCPL
jgi:hypothetical protein